MFFASRMGPDDARIVRERGRDSPVIEALSTFKPKRREEIEYEVGRKNEKKMITTIDLDIPGS